MHGYPLPENEIQRLTKLREYQILDSLPEATYDRVVRLATINFNVPIALISLIEDERQWFKAKIGFSEQDASRSTSFCAHTICQDDIYVIENALNSEVFSQNPSVIGDAHVRFYAGAPLRAPGGLNIGTLAIIDTKPRKFSDEEVWSLRCLAEMVIDALEMRSMIDRAERSEQRLIDAMESLPNGFVLYDKNDRLVICNQRYRDLYAKSADLMVPGAFFSEIIRKGVERGQYIEAVGREEEWIAKRLKDHNNPGEPIEQKLPDDKWLRVQERRTSEGGFVGFRIDISQLKQQERKLEQLAWTDSLTSALNRHRFMELAGKELDRAKRHNHEMSFMLLDADHFKQINDEYGHAAGDAVLIELVKRSTKVLRAHDLMGRFGGEEFCVLLPDVDAAGAARAAERLRKAVAELPFIFEGQLIKASISIGVATLAADEGLRRLMKRADTALYQAKNAGRDCVQSAA
ncbi:diguanylate cyclase [Lentilitoribacter sp. EG35]|uniref:sensor domain-containing diguanylate cyclase n=1 Tax=Lentilitoribacter sp. EG35 TaxID=3234192 RepID=UPI003461784A